MTTNSKTHGGCRGGEFPTVLSIHSVGSSGGGAEEWSGNKLLNGDIVEEIKIGSLFFLKSPFKNGKSGVQEALHRSFKAKERSVAIRVRRCSLDKFTEFQACIVPDVSSRKKKQYMLRSIDYPDHTVMLIDRSESDCLALQGRAELRDGYVDYAWEKRMKEVLPIPNSSCFLSILILPKVSEAQMEDTLTRANVWLYASQASGVPILFLNIQTESLLTKLSVEPALSASSSSSTRSFSDLCNLTNSSIYSLEDHHGVDIAVARAVRLWYSPPGGEIPVHITLSNGDSMLGFSINRTQEGFIYISSVDEGEGVALPAGRSGLRELYRDAEKAGSLLVVSRVSNEKVLPWMVSSAGAIRCYDTFSLRQKLLSLHRKNTTIVIHVFMWCNPSSSWIRSPPPVRDVAEEVGVTWQSRGSRHTLQLSQGEEGEEDEEEESYSLELTKEYKRDTTREFSFKFHDFSLRRSHQK